MIIKVKIDPKLPSIQTIFFTKVLGLNTEMNLAENLFLLEDMNKTSLYIRELT